MLEFMYTCRRELLQRRPLQFRIKFNKVPLTSIAHRLSDLIHSLGILMPISALSRISSGFSKTVNLLKILPWCSYLTCTLFSFLTLNLSILNACIIFFRTEHFLQFFRSPYKVHHMLLTLMPPIMNYCIFKASAWKGNVEQAYLWLEAHTRKTV
jgi:hypothetical protein